MKGTLKGCDMNLSNAKVQRTDWIGHSSALRKMTKDEEGNAIGWLYKDDDVQSFAGLAMLHGVMLADIDGFIEGLEAQSVGAGAELRERRTKAFESRKDKEVFLRNLEWITSRRREIQRESAFRGEIKRLKREAATPTQPAPEQTTATPAPVEASRCREKKPSIEAVALDYMRAEFNQGQFQSAAKFHKYLKTTAGVNNSPFEMGTGINASKLFCPAAGSFFDAGTLGKIWPKIRAG